MDEKKNYVITNENELQNFYFELLDMCDRSYMNDTFDVSNLDLKPLTLKFDNGDENDSGTISTSMMDVVIEIQKQVYALAREYKGKNLSPEEKKKLELKVRVKSGCTEIIIEIIKLIFPELSNMSTEQLVIVADAVKVCAFVIAGYGVAKGAFHFASNVITKRIEASKEKRQHIHEEEMAKYDLEKTKIKAELEKNKDNLEAQERLVRIEAETERINKQTETWEKALDSSLSMLRIDESGNRRVYKKLASYPGEIKIDNTDYSKEELSAMSEEPEQEEPEVTTKTYKGLFLINKKDYSKNGDAVEVEMKSIDGQHVIKAPLPPDMFTDDELNDIEHKKPIKLSVTGDFKDGKLVSDKYSILVLRNESETDKTGNSE